MLLTQSFKRLINWAIYYDADKNRCWGHRGTLILEALAANVILTEALGERRAAYASLSSPPDPVRSCFIPEAPSVMHEAVDTSWYRCPRRVCHLVKLTSVS